MQEADPDVCLLASQYSLIGPFQRAQQRLSRGGDSVTSNFVIGSSLNAGFISGSARYNYGKNSWDIPRKYIEKREKLPRAWPPNTVVDLSKPRPYTLTPPTPDVAAALIVECTERRADPRQRKPRCQTSTPPDFWAELKRQGLIEPKTRQRRADERAVRISSTCRAAATKPLVSGGASKRSQAGGSISTWS